MGMTDVDDKIINKANETNATCTSVASKFEADFWEDRGNLGDFGERGEEVEGGGVVVLESVGGGVGGGGWML